MTSACPDSALCWKRSFYKPELHPLSTLLSSLTQRFPFFVSSKSAPSLPGLHHRLSGGLRSSSGTHSILDFYSQVALLPFLVSKEGCQDPVFHGNKGNVTELFKQAHGFHGGGGVLLINLIMQSFSRAKSSIQIHSWLSKKCLGKIMAQWGLAAQGPKDGTVLSTLLPPEGTFVSCDLLCVALISRSTYFL